ncbi:hypothetical protein [Clavibacter michiganensis]|uniref:hypothetical protein n=1 Tax=Clavibacter michiganensis TaxID=28447 RepID=UPI0005BB2D46|nr:hypothetical protein [Clavibacter michiganensis]
MPSDPRTTFREQATGPVSGFLCIVSYLLFQVARRTEVRTEDDRVLVVVCTIGAFVTAALLVAVVVRVGIRRRRESAAARLRDREDGA